MQTPPIKHEYLRIFLIHLFIYNLHIWVGLIIVVAFNIFTAIPGMLYV